MPLRTSIRAVLATQKDLTGYLMTKGGVFLRSLLLLSPI